MGGRCFGVFWRFNAQTVHHTIQYLQGEIALQNNRTHNDMHTVLYYHKNPSYLSAVFKKNILTDSVYSIYRSGIFEQSVESESIERNGVIKRFSCEEIPKFSYRMKVISLFNDFYLC